MPLLKAEMVEILVKTGALCRVDAKVAPRFRCGEHVVVGNINPLHHTRLPRYVAVSAGLSSAIAAFSFFLTRMLTGRATRPSTSTVCVSRGPQASERDVLYLDLWDDYMDAV